MGDFRAIVAELVGSLEVQDDSLTVAFAYAGRGQSGDTRISGVGELCTSGKAAAGSAAGHHCISLNECRMPAACVVYCSRCWYAG